MSIYYNRIQRANQIRPEGAKKKYPVDYSTGMNKANALPTASIRKNLWLSVSVLSMQYEGEPITKVHFAPAGMLVAGR